MARTSGIINETITISTTDKTYQASKNAWFKTETVKIKTLPDILISNNYSLINWHGGKRLAVNFKFATGFVADIDEGLTISDAQSRLDRQGLNYILVPSKSHTAEQHRFHIILFFSHPVFSSMAYEKIGKEIVSKMFPESDSSVTDSARFIFGSPKSVSITTNFNGNNINVMVYDHLWTSSLEINIANGDWVTIDECEGHTSCYCPFHEDSNPSAFVDYSDQSNNWYISCSTCGETLWMEKKKDQLDTILEPYYHYSKYIHELGIKGGEFFIHPIDTSFFHIITNTNGDKKERDTAYTKLCKTKHISHLCRIDLIGDADTEENYYGVNTNDGVITVHYAPIQENKKDNDFVEKYLEDRFQIYAKFIKEYLAMYCYTNYEKLPTLVFNSPRGNGKSTFAEMVGSIYKPLAIEWHGVETNFSYEAEKKLLLVEENDTKGEKQYITLKKYGGEKDAQVRKKYQAPYSVRNNMNIMILTNEVVPMFVKAKEMPYDETNNQFFTWEFPEFTDGIDNNIPDKLEAHIGHYIRTKLKDVYEELIGNNVDCRYSIKVPITDYEKKMFKASISPVELDANDIIEFICHMESNDYNRQYFDFVTDGLLPQELVKNRLTVNHHEIFKNLNEREYITLDTSRPMKDGKQYRCYLMTKKFREKFNEVQKTKKK